MVLFPVDGNPNSFNSVCVSCMCVAVTSRPQLRLFGFGGRSGRLAWLPALVERPVETAAEELSEYLQLQRSQGGHCCSNSQQPSPWQRVLRQRLPQQLCSRSVEGEVRKSGLQRRGPRSPNHRPEGLSVCPGPSIWFVCACGFLSASESEAV